MAEQYDASGEESITSSQQDDESFIDFFGIETEIETGTVSGGAGARVQEQGDDEGPEVIEPEPGEVDQPEPEGLGEALIVELG